ncbi:nucleotidyltransferase domain-containing protein [Streptomyces tropicalis]|uniref:Nucleotidyltransferase domain-containing protein n=1 Tax=Streptomyces tropicalis TaxID=3034234 RepID=A0ABT6A600_9ACTN|nr:nucleotidyltransferase domain-containing protein [Streptomyces tropicalis]MDF3300076.1 nucleotidyltransferase domain-containing protein [Streptomyces tropicalis]
MLSDGDPVHHQAGVAPERSAEIDAVVGRVAGWARDRRDIAGVLLVGSCARGAARPDSDVDIVLLTRNPREYLGEDAWALEIGLGGLIRTRSWGPMSERRYLRASGLEVEMGIGSPEWARTDPVDPGTQRVVADGARILHDPVGILARLLTAC